MGAHNAHHESAGTRERRPHHPGAVAPPPEAFLKPRAWSRLMPFGLSTAGARRRRQRRAGRRQERGRSQSREARPAERSAAGCLDEVEKPVTAPDGRMRHLGNPVYAWCAELPKREDG